MAFLYKVLLVKKMIGNILRQLRYINNNEPLRSVAHSLKIDESTVAKIEKDYFHSNIKTIKKFADYYNFPYEYLLILSNLEDLKLINNKEIMYYILEYYLYNNLYTEDAILSRKKK